MTNDHEATDDPIERLSLIEETATVGKRDVRTGMVRVKTVTDTMEETVRAALQSESFEVTRVPIGREVAVAPEIRTEGDLTIIPVLEEVLFVETRLVLKEEIHLRRRVDIDMTETPVTLRRQRAVVERIEDPVTQDPISSPASNKVPS